MASSARADGVRFADSKWRQRPYFNWRHQWTRLDILALILTAGGAYAAIHKFADSHYLAGFAGLGMTLVGVTLFLMASPSPD